MSKSAIDYAALIGRYVDMSRPATDGELANEPDMLNIGGSGVVFGVEDDYHGGVTIVFGYGTVTTIFPEDEGWMFKVYATARDARVKQ